MTISGTIAFLRTAFASTMAGGTTYLLVGAAALAFVGGVWIAGVSEGKSRQKAVCDVASLKKTIADQTSTIIEQQFAIKRFEERLAVAEDARRAAQRRQIRDAELVDQLKVKADDFKREIERRPDRWRISPDDARRLREIGR